MSDGSISKQVCVHFLFEAKLFQTFNTTGCHFASLGPRTVIISVVMSVGVAMTQSKCVFSQRSLMTALAAAVLSLPVSDIAVASEEPEDFRTSSPSSG